MDGVKKCALCRTVKPRSEFYKDNQKSDGYSSRCGNCLRSRPYVRNRVAANARNAKYRSTTKVNKVHESPETYLWYVAKWRAKARQLDFDITPEDIIIPTHCPLLGTPLTVLLKRGKGASLNKASLDRIDNTKGYIKGNIRVVSMKANYMKNAITLEFAENLVKYMKGDL
jgi:hypothetical protein